MSAAGEIEIVFVIEATKTQTKEKKDSIYFEYISMVKSHRGKGLCQFFLVEFITQCNCLFKKRLFYELYNLGGLKACKCYARAFTSKGYDIFRNVTATTEEHLVDVDGITEFCKGTQNNGIFDMLFKPNASSKHNTFFQQLHGIRSLHKLCV